MTSFFLFLSIMLLCLTAQSEKVMVGDCQPSDCGKNQNCKLRYDSADPEEVANYVCADYERCDPNNRYDCSHPHYECKTINESDVTYCVLRKRCDPRFRSAYECPLHEHCVDGGYNENRWFCLPNKGCNFTKDCGKGFTCDKEKHLCSLHISCAVDRDCPLPNYCQTNGQSIGVCVPFEKCTSDANCSSAFHCSDKYDEKFCIRKTSHECDLRNDSSCGSEKFCGFKSEFDIEKGRNSKVTCIPYTKENEPCTLDRDQERCAPGLVCTEKYSKKVYYGTEERFCLKTNSKMKELEDLDRKRPGAVTFNCKTDSYCGAGKYCGVREDKEGRYYETNCYTYLKRWDKCHKGINELLCEPGLDCLASIHDAYDYFCTELDENLNVKERPAKNWLIRFINALSESDADLHDGFHRKGSRRRG